MTVSCIVLYVLILHCHIKLSTNECDITNYETNVKTVTILSDMRIIQSKPIHKRMV